MAVTDWKTCGAVSADGWSNTSYSTISAVDSNYIAHEFDSPVSYDLQRITCTQFGISDSDVPPNSAIDGIEVELTGRSDIGTVNTTTIRCLKNDTLTDSVSRDFEWGRTEISLLYGGSEETFGTTWSQSDIIYAGFGVTVDLYVTGYGRFPPPTYSYVYLLNCLRLRVYYTPMLLPPNILRQIRTPIATLGGKPVKINLINKS